MAIEQVKLDIPIAVKIDPKSIKQAEADVKAFQKSLSKTSIDWQSFGKAQQAQAKELLRVGKEAEALGGRIAKGARDSTQKLKTLGQALDDAKKEAAEVAKKMGQSSDQKDTSGLAARAKQIEGTIAKLNKQFDSQLKAQKVNEKSIKDSSKAQKDSMASIRKAASNFDIGSVAKGITSGLKMGGVAGVKSALESLGSGAARAAKGSSSRMAGAVEKLGAATAVIGTLVQLFMSLSSNATTLNKALVNGIGLAGDVGNSVGEYTAAVDSLRQSVVRTGGSFADLGVDAEGGMSAIGAFAKESSGSIIQAQKFLKDFGKGNLDRGVESFVKSAALYGKALDMSVQDVSSMMGGFVSEIGIGSDNVIKTMGMIVKQAAQAGMPTHKFMDIFREAIPNLDLFTNRIEELTGVIKLMSKTMNPRSVKGFMDAFSKGFDQMDFKQRLKMVFVVGPGKMANIMNKGVQRATDALSAQMPSLAGDMAKALKSQDPIKAMREVAGKAMAQGASGAQIEAINKAGRMAAMTKSKDPLKMATGMRDMGLMERMESLESYAGAFTGGDITGLGEHVAKQLGVSESEYKAILQLKDNMGDFSAQIRATGRTSSVSLNDNLKKLLNLSKMSGESDEDFEKRFESTMKGLPQKDLEDKIKEASINQISEDEQRAKEEEKGKQSMEELSQENINATLSAGDKLDNILKVLLQKVYAVLDDISNWVSSLFDSLPSWLSGSNKELNAAMDSFSKQFEKSGTLSKTGMKYMREVNNGIKAQANSGMSREDILQSNQDAMGEMTLDRDSEGNVTKESEDKLRAILSKAFNEKGQDAYIEAAKKGDFATTNKMLTGDDFDVAGESGVSKEGLAKILSQASYFKAHRMTDDPNGPDPEKVRGNRYADKRKSKEAKENDLDPRTAMLYDQAAGGSGPSGISPSGVPVRMGTTTMNGQGPLLDALPTRTGSTTMDSGAPVRMGTTTMGAPGAPGSGGQSAEEMKIPPPGHDEQMKVMEEQGKSQEEIAQFAADDYQNSSDVLALLKKGIKFEQSWMKNQFANVLKESTLDSFRKALTEFSILLAKFLSDEDFTEAYAGHGQRIIDEKKTMTDFIPVIGNDETMWADAFSHATGLEGVPYDNYLARLHKGEMVMPASEARSMKNSGGSTGRVTNVVVYAQGVPSSEIARRIGQIASSD